MSLVLNPVVGTIRIEPLADVSYTRRASDDSTLDALLASLATSELLGGGDGGPAVLITSKRVSRRLPWPQSAVAAAGADFARLQEDLQAEYEELTGSLAD
jgi:hypothetical protein